MINLEEVKRQCEARIEAGANPEPVLVAAVLICTAINEFTETIANYGDFIVEQMRRNR